MMNLKMTVAALAIVVSGAAQAAVVDTPVDVELALGIDVSGSVNATEYALQLGGYVGAFNNPTIQASILSMANGRLGKTAAMLYQWSSASQQVVSVGWTLLDSNAAITAFATNIQAVIRAFASTTAVGNAIAFGSAQFAANGFDGLKQVIDISGDGEQNAGIDTSDARDAALASGIDRINGIAIGPAALLTFYEDNVIGGTDSFALQAANFADFETAITRKLKAEITGGPPTIPLPAAGWMMIAAIGGLAALRRRKAA